MGHAGIVAHALDVIDDVVGVFLQRVVDARLEVGLRSVVVDAQPTADVQVFQTRAAAIELDVHARGLVQRLLDVANVGNLAAEMEVQELEAVLHAALFELFQGAEDFRDGEAELRAESARALPAAAGLGRELDADANRGTHADLGGVFKDQSQLGVLFHDGNDAAADFLREHRHLDELGILESVADDRRVVRCQRYHGQ